MLEFFENQQLELDRTDRPDWSALQAKLDGRPGPTQIAARQHVPVWRSLIRRYEVPPKLVLVGKRGWESEQVFRELDYAPDLVGHVLEVPSLPSAHLKTLMSNAVALLMPSFAEGYGLPIVEALSLRVPVICSDIAVFREVSQGQALFRSPIDGTGWLSAVEAMILPDAALRTELVGKANHFKAPSWSAYFRNVDSFLRSV